MSTCNDPFLQNTQSCHGILPLICQPTGVLALILYTKWKDIGTLYATCKIEVGGANYSRTRAAQSYRISRAAKMATKDAVVLINHTSIDHDAKSNQQSVAGETSFSDPPSDIAPKPMSKQDDKPRVKVNAEMKHKFCGLRARIAGLLVVTVAVWSLLLIPIVIFYVSTVSWS